MSVLTISREYGSGGKEIGRAVADALGYDYIDRGHILEDMKNVGPKWEKEASHFDEHFPNVYERYEWSYRGFVALNQFHILKYALQNNVVIMGRGGNFLLRGIPFVLKVRTNGLLTDRIERVMRWEETNSEIARWLIGKADREMAGAVHVIYGRNWDDPEAYDLVFNTSEQSIETITATITSELKIRNASYNDYTRKILELRALAAQIRAEIAIDTRLSVSSVDVEPKEEGLVQFGLVLRAEVNNQEDIKELEKIARQVAGEVPLECFIHYRWHSRFGPWRFR